MELCSGRWGPEHPVLTCLNDARWRLLTDHSDIISTFAGAAHLWACSRQAVTRGASSIAVMAGSLGCRATLIKNAILLQLRANCCWHAIRHANQSMPPRGSAADGHSGCC